MQRLLLRLWRDTEGQTTVEYALIATLVIGLAVISLLGFGPSINAMYSTVVDRLTAVLG